MNARKRLISFDLLKLFAMFLVIWGHCIQYLLHSDAFDNQIFIHIYAFHMPLFMMIAGFFAKGSLEKKKSSEIIKKKFMNLIVPCINMGVLLMLVNIIKEGLWGQITLGKLNILFDSLIIKDLWFLKSLFCCFVLASFAYAGRKFRYLKISLTVIASFFLNFYMIKRMYLFFVIGIFLNSHFGLFKKYARAICISSLIMFLFLLQDYDKNIYLTQIGDVKDCILSADINLIITTVRHYIHNIFTGLVGCTTFISLFCLLEDRFSNHILIDIAKVGQFTLGIYIIQYVILERNLSYIINFDQISTFNFNVIIAPLLSIVLLICCSLMTRFFARKKTTSFFLLGKY